MRTLACEDLSDFVFGRAQKPVVLGNGMTIGGGLVYPEINFTLPSMEITEATMPQVLAQYREMTTGVCQRSRELIVPGLAVEIELLPPMTINPHWGADVTRAVKEILVEFEAKHGLKTLLRVTPVDIREGDLQHMWRGTKWDLIMETFRRCAEEGADLLAIESIGGKNLHDDAVMYGELAKAVFALGVVDARDMAQLWSSIGQIAEETKTIPSGDTACAFANTAMVLADRGYVSKVFAAVIRVISAVRSLVAVEQGARGPHKDCGYEGVYLKAIAGIPISMEGKSSACAHLSPVGNVAGALADLWSNESVENVKLLGGMAPVISVEQLAYDCRLYNTATAQSHQLVLRDLLADSDSRLDPQAYVLRPDVVLRLSREIIKGDTPLERALRAGQAVVSELRQAVQEDRLVLSDREENYLAALTVELDGIIPYEEEFTAQMLAENTTAKFRPELYDLG